MDRNIELLVSEALPAFDLSIPTEINSGGCGVFAKLLYEELIKNNIPCKIYALFNHPKEDKQYKFFNEFINKGVIKGAGVEHILVLIDDTFYVDSTGIMNAAFWHAKVKVEISYNQLCQLVDEKDAWNNIFDSDCIPLMKSKLDEIFSHISNISSREYIIPDKPIRMTDKTISEWRKL